MGQPASCQNVHIGMQWLDSSLAVCGAWRGWVGLYGIPTWVNTGSDGETIRLVFQHYAI